MSDDRIIPEFQYKEYFDFVKDNKDKLFIDGFDIVQLKGFIVSPHDDEPCYLVLTYNYNIETGAIFYLTEVPVIMGLTPIETLSHYERLYQHWKMNVDVIGIMNER